MKNVCVVAMLAAALAGSTLVSASAEPASKAAIKNIVLVHGAFADGSGWKAVAEILEKDGYTVSVAQPPETSYADDVKSIRRPQSTLWAARSFWSATAMAGPSSPRPATTHTSRHWSTSPHLRSMKAKAARRLNRRFRKPPRRSSRTATAIGG